MPVITRAKKSALKKLALKKLALKKLVRHTHKKRKEAVSKLRYEEVAIKIGRRRASRCHTRYWTLFGVRGEWDNALEELQHV